MTILPQLKQHVVDAAAAHLPKAPAEQEQVSRRQRRIGRGQRARYWFTAGAALVAAAGAILALLIVSPISPPPAYALTHNPDGTITVTLNDLASATPHVNAEFARLGIDETVIPLTRSCTQSADILLQPPTRRPHESVTLTAGRKYLLPGWHGVLLAVQGQDGKARLSLAVVYGRVPSCLGLGYPGFPAAREGSPSVPAPLSTGRQAALLAEQALIASDTTHK